MDHQMDFGRGTGRRTVQHLSYPDLRIFQEAAFSGQRFDDCVYCQPPTEGTSCALLDELVGSPASEARGFDALESLHEIQKENDAQESEEQEEQEEQLKDFTYQKETHDAEYYSPLTADGCDEECESEDGCAQTSQSPVHHSKTQDEINVLFQRKENDMQKSSRKHVPTCCQNLCCRGPTSPQMHRQGHLPNDAINKENEMEADRAKRQERTKCLVCFKTLKRSYYMKVRDYYEWPFLLMTFSTSSYTRILFTLNTKTKLLS